MLTSDYLDVLPDSVVELYERYCQSVLNDIARRLAKMDYAKAGWQVQRLNESALLYEDILEKLSDISGRSKRELNRIFKNAGVRAMRFDDGIYRKAGLTPTPLNQSPAMQDVLSDGLRTTQNTLQNLTNTTALTGQNAFLDAADLAHMQIATGTFDYDTAIRNAVKELAEKGLSVINYASGHKDRLDVAVRRAVLTGVNQTAGRLTEARADEVGCDLVQTSAHIGARNIGDVPENHEKWQGRVFSRSGSHPKYPNFYEITGFGTGPGLCGWNCRHSFYPFFEGISENAYSKATLNSYARRKVTYEGNEISVYEATQKQRSIERRIRKWKREAGALEAAGLDNNTAKAKVREWQAKMRDFTKQTKLSRQYQRERIFTTPERVKSIDTDQENIVKAIHNLKDKKEIVGIGKMDFDFSNNYPDSVTRQVILTGERKQHILESHPEMEDYLGVIPKMLTEFVDIHRDKTDPKMAIIYLGKDKEHLLRIVLWISNKSNLQNSIHSMRIAGKSEYLSGLEAWRSLLNK